MEIQSVLEDVSNVKKKLSVEISAQVTSEEFNRVAGEFKKRADLPGFRKGRAPFNLVKRRFQRDIREEVIKRLVPESYHQAIHEKDVSPVRSPNVGELDFEEGEALKYVAEFEVKPTFELPGYAGLKVRLDPPPDPEEVLEKRLDALQEKHSSLITIEDRGVDLGDYAVIDLHGRFISEEGLPLVGLDPIADENVVLEIGGEQTHEAFTKALLGLNVAEEKVFQVSYPPDYPDRKLAGERVEFTVQLNNIKNKQVPPLDDDFARDIGDFDNLEELKGSLLEEVSQQAEAGREEEIRNKTVEALVDLTTFEVPEVLVEEVVDNKLQEFAFSLASRGVDPAKAGLDWYKMRDEFQAPARKEVRAHFGLEAVAGKEEIEVTEEEVDSEIKRLSESSQESSAKVRQYFAEDEHREELLGRLKRKKVIDLLVEKATVDG